MIGALVVVCLERLLVHLERSSEHFLEHLAYSECRSTTECAFISTLCDCSGACRSTYFMHLLEWLLSEFLVLYLERSMWWRSVRRCGVLGV